MMITPEQLMIGVAADLAVGDPRWLPHPVVGMGKLAAGMERVWRRSALPLPVAGIGAWCGVLSVVVGVVMASLRWLPAPYIQIYWIYSLLAVRSLDDHAMAVVKPLRAKDLAAARTAVSRIVGRDTAQLDERGVTRAMIETVAENLSDGVIAPLFWLVVGGPVAMGAYKAINTLDSMFGYRNERYAEFGWCSARMDDLANWLPARITALLIWLLALLPGMSMRRSVWCTWRDASRQPSPNSGYPEAAVAGALGVELGGVNFYRGVGVEKARLGDDIRTLDWRVYPRMRVLLYGSALLFTGLAVGGLQWR